MKNYLIMGLIIFGSYNLNSQEINANVKKGDVFVIVKPSGIDYKHINFPRKNIIIKRGGILTNQLVDGKKVVVTNVTKDKNNATLIRIETINKTGFYKAIKSVTVDYEKALKSGEIKISSI